MERVDDMFKPSLNIVVISKTVGNVENSKTDLVNNVMSKILIAIVKFVTMKISSNDVGSGMMINPTMPTTRKEITISAGVNPPFFAFALLSNLLPPD